jgi:putative colanic acid biosysnthesis UDP-glucose lipid carrier transferase
MNRSPLVIKLPLKRKITKHNAAIFTYLNKSNSSAGTTYLYRVMYKAYTPKNASAIYFIQLPLHKAINRFVKRAIDILVSMVIITTILSWLIPLMAILIRASSAGPVFFLQKRHKQNGAIFTCIKFRSMIVNPMADILPAAINDKRVTPLGRFLRKTFIDELPQFFNVLWGDMSVIGPRPHMLSESLRFEEQVQHYSYREKIKPGITGLSQVMGLEGAADNIYKMKARVDMDIFYLRHWSLKLDAVILYRTIRKMAGL